MASNATNLKNVCQAIRNRHNQADGDVFRCIVCENQMKGSDALMIHLLEFHQVSIEHFDNVADLQGMLSFLQSVIHPESGTLACPVCRHSCNEAVSLQEHLVAEDHLVWKRHTISGLSEFCIASGTDDGADDHGADSQDDPQDVIAEGDLDDEDEEVEETVCLYCPEVCKLRQLEAHLMTVHNLDLPNFVRTRQAAIGDEYALIRMANFVRERRDACLCPVESCGLKASSHDAWSKHVVDCGHHFPEAPPADERYLIPRIPGDMLISYLLECTWLDEDEDKDESSKYPMVETVHQQAVRRGGGAAA